MSFIPIDPAAWERVEYFEYFQSTTLYITAQVDITLLYERLKRRGLRLYPALVYLAAWPSGAMGCAPSPLYRAQKGPPRAFFNEAYRLFGAFFHIL